jgi:NitT/TauT family transport system permease protein
MPDLSSIDSFRNRVLSVALLVVILGLWEAAVRVIGIPSFVLPPPSQVAWGLWRGFSTGLCISSISP